MAERAEALAEESAAGGHGTSAAGAWLRATEYWRQAIFFIRDDLDDARLQDGLAAACRGVSGGAAAPALCDHHRGSAVRRRDDDRVPDAASRDRPRRGATYPLPAVSTRPPRPAMPEVRGWRCDRGMNAFIFEGPGQGGMLYEHRVPMRPDFEAVLPPVVDWLVATGRRRCRQAGAGRPKLRRVSRAASRGARATARRAGLRSGPVRVRLAAGAGD